MDRGEAGAPLQPSFPSYCPPFSLQADQLTEEQIAGENCLCLLGVEVMTGISQSAKSGWQKEAGIRSAGLDLSHILTHPSLVVGEPGHSCARANALALSIGSLSLSERNTYSILHT